MRWTRPACACLLLAAGCASEPDGRGDRAAPVTLPLDPTEPYTLAEWWTDGARLLHLASDNAYALYPGQNRYHAPQEAGQWRRHSYAALWLEPYAAQLRPRQRVSVTRSEGRIVLTIGGGAGFRPLDAAPQMLEDRLIGLWRGDAGVLRLGGDLRYEFTPPGLDPGPVAVTSHRGSWAVADGTLRLKPDSAGAPPMTLRVEPDAERIVLEGEPGSLRRAGADAPDGAP
jgi:hypothetical protein